MIYQAWENIFFLKQSPLKNMEIRIEEKVHSWEERWEEKFISKYEPHMFVRFKR